MRTSYGYNNGKDIMPLMMNFTAPTAIEISEPVAMTYNEKEQISSETRTVGTRSLRSRWTSATKSRAGRTDKANEIDDSKWVR